MVGFGVKEKGTKPLMRICRGAAVVLVRPGRLTYLAGMAVGCQVIPYAGRRVKIGSRIPLDRQISPKVVLSWVIGLCGPYAARQRARRFQCLFALARVSNAPTGPWRFGRSLVSLPGRHGRSIASPPLFPAQFSADPCPQGAPGHTSANPGAPLGPPRSPATRPDSPA